LFDYGAVGREKAGVFVEPVDLNRLLTSIVVSPIAAESFRDEVKASVIAAGYQIRVEDSPIRELPRRAFE
jgi:hypothetical protein